MQTEDETMQIKDLGDACALSSTGHRLLRLENAKIGSHKVFFFRDTPEARDILDRYRGHDLQVDAHSFFTTIKEMKSRIHDMD